ncbi:hypothetical protein BH09ACT7_BH09ACT7_08280 [soil metagenome]
MAKVPRESQNPYKGAGGRTPKSEFNITPTKTPKTSVSDGLASKDRNVQFTFCDADLDGPWSIAELAADHVGDLFRFLKDIESQTIGELSGQNTSRLYKEYPNFEKCPNDDAKARLANLYDSADNICRLELTGKQRLYGLRFEHLIAILWWDPDHDIWPSTKK